jgi:putative oxidoreductase
MWILPWVMIRAVLTRPLFADLGLLVLRVLTGALLIHHGYEKLANIENFADAFVRPLHLPFPIVLSYVAAFSEVIGSWLLITGLLTRVGAAAIAGTITVAIYHAIVTAGFNIYLLELLGLYLAAAGTVLACGPGLFSIDELISRLIEPNIEIDSTSESLDEPAVVLSEVTATR